MRSSIPPSAAAAGLVMASAALVLLGLGAVPPGAKPDMVEMEVKDVLTLEGDQSNVVILKEKGKETIVPIFIGPAEALAIQARLTHETPPRPMTHDLLEKVIRSLGATITRVHIDDVRGNVYFGRIYLTQGARSLELDARPSDSIALALGYRVPIFAARKVIDEAGLTRKDLESLRRTPPQDGEEFPGRHQQKL